VVGSGRRRWNESSGWSILTSHNFSARTRLRHSDETPPSLGFLGGCDRQRRNAKTIVFAMKIFDLLHRIAIGRYAAFVDVPIVADLRIARLSFSSGLVGAPRAQSVPSTLVAAGELLQRDPALFIDAWSRVSTAGRRLNLFRVDSLAW